MNPSDEPLTHREVLKILVGLLAGLFTAILSATIVANALPTIVADLDGTQQQYTWVVTSALLMMTVTTSIWGKLSDSVDKTLLFQIAIVVFAVGTLLCGLSRSMPELIASRGLQGAGMGGLMACTQSILGAIVPPRERGRYTGYMGATFTVATVAGPILGGIIVDTPLGWRWTFFICLPLSLLSWVLVRRTLHIEWPRARARFDIIGAILLTSAASLPMIWITFAGDTFAWASTTSLLMLGGAAFLTVAFIVVEQRHSDPLIDLNIITERSVGLSIIASVAVGLSMFGTAVFLGQYFQVSAGYAPAVAGLLTIPFMVGMFSGVSGSGPIIARTGHWKPFVVTGGACMTAGASVLSFIADDSSMVWVLAATFVLGLGTGLLLQNLLLVAQNAVDVSIVGATSGAVAFFRSWGGSMGVATLGALIALHVGTSEDPVLYGEAMATAFLGVAVLSTITLICVIFLPSVPLRMTLAKQD